MVDFEPTLWATVCIARATSIARRARLLQKSNPLAVSQDFKGPDQ